MLLSGTHSKTQTVLPGAEITQHDVRSFRANVGLALAASESVIVDLRSTNRIDSWAFIAIWELAETFGPRLSFAVPDYLRGSIPPADPP
jgi:anti-anti-sigma regulatory factor